MRKTFSSLYQSKEKAYSDIIKINTNKSIIQKMGTIFMNSENSKISKSDVLILNLADKTDLRRGEKTLFFLVFITHGQT